MQHAFLGQKEQKSENWQKSIYTQIPQRQRSAFGMPFFPLHSPLFLNYPNDLKRCGDPTPFLPSPIPVDILLRSLGLPQYYKEEVTELLPSAKPALTYLVPQSIWAPPDWSGSPRQHCERCTHRLLGHHPGHLQSWGCHRVTGWSDSHQRSPLCCCKRHMNHETSYITSALRVLVKVSQN